MQDITTTQWTGRRHDDWFPEDGSRFWFNWRYRYPLEEASLSVFAARQNPGHEHEVQVSYTPNDDGIVDTLIIEANGEVRPDADGRTQWVRTVDNSHVNGYQRWVCRDARYGIVDVVTSIENGRLLGVSIWPNDNERILNLQVQRPQQGVSVPNTWPNTPEAAFINSGVMPGGDPTSTEDHYNGEPGASDIGVGPTCFYCHRVIRAGDGGEWIDTADSDQCAGSTTGVNRNFTHTPTALPDDPDVLRADIQLLQDLLHEEAINRAWCSEYEAFIAKFNTRSQVVKFTGRSYQYHGAITVEFDFDAERNGDARGGMNVVVNTLDDVIRRFGTLRNIQFASNHRRV